MAQAARPRRTVTGVYVAIAVVIVFLCICVSGLLALYLRPDWHPKPPATCPPTQVPVVCPPTNTPISCPPTNTPITCPPTDTPTPCPPTDTPTPCPPTATPKPTRCPSTAAIVLQVRCPARGCCCTVAGLYTVVQWQDKHGNWQPVEKWAGTLDEHGCIRWKVDCKDLGKGPFRWIVFNECRCSVAAASEPFNLPEEPGDTVRIELTLGR